MAFVSAPRELVFPEFELANWTAAGMDAMQDRQFDFSGMSGMDRRTWIGLATAVFLVGSYGAAAETDGSSLAGTWLVDTQTSRVFIFVDKTGFGHQHGVAGLVQSGSLTLHATRDAGRLVFAMSRFTADTAEARRYCGLSGETDKKTMEKVNQNMLGAAVLDVARHPEATFQVDSSLPTGSLSRSGMPLYELSGTFTLHGVSHPLRVVAEASNQNGSVHLRGQFKLSQTRYGIKPFSAVLGAVGVADELIICGEFDLRR